MRSIIEHDTQETRRIPESGWQQTICPTAERGVAMQGSATVTMSAPADKVWDLIADVRNTGRFSPEVFESEWLDGATGPALGARFRGT
jgi:hypothetical protein